MLGYKISKLAKQWGFKLLSDIAYGRLDGYLVSFREDIGCKEMAVALSFKDEEGFEQAKGFLSTPYNMETYGIMSSSGFKRLLIIKFLDTEDFTLRIERFRKIFFAYIEGKVYKNHCYVCDEELGEDEADIRLIDNIAYQVHASCVDKLEQMIAQHDKSYMKDRTVKKGIGGAVAGAALGSLPWMLSQIAATFVVGFLGFVIGYAAKKGYEKTGGTSGGKKTLILALISSGFAAVTQLIGWLIAFAVNRTAFRANPFTVFVRVFTTPDFLHEYVGTLLLCVWAIILGCSNFWHINRRSHQEPTEIRRG